LQVYNVLNFLKLRREALFTAMQRRFSWLVLAYFSLCFGTFYAIFLIIYIYPDHGYDSGCVGIASSNHTKNYIKKSFFLNL